MALFLDTSAVVKLFVVETGSPAVEQAIRSDRDVFVGSLTVLEFLSAIRRKVREGVLTDREAATEIAGFDGKFLAAAKVVPFGDEASLRARALLERHASAGLRVLDAVQLACCLAVPGAAMMLADRPLARIAEAEGVTTRVVG
jgi:predicted nucleic acid-binding protein